MSCRARSPRSGPTPGRSDRSSATARKRPSASSSASCRTRSSGQGRDASRRKSPPRPRSPNIGFSLRRRRRTSPAPARKARWSPTSIPTARRRRKGLRPGDVILDAAASRSRRPRMWSRPWTTPRRTAAAPCCCGSRPATIRISSRFPRILREARGLQIRRRGAPSSRKAGNGFMRRAPRRQAGTPLPACRLFFRNGLCMPRHAHSDHRRRSPGRPLIWSRLSAKPAITPTSAADGLAGYAQGGKLAITTC